MSNLNNFQIKMMHMTIKKIINIQKKSYLQFLFSIFLDMIYENRIHMLVKMKAYCYLSISSLNFLYLPRQLVVWKVQFFFLLLNKRKLTTSNSKGQSSWSMKHNRIRWRKEYAQYLYYFPKHMIVESLRIYNWT